MAQPTSALYRLIDSKLRKQGGIDHFVTAQRATLLGWPEVADAIFNATGERVNRETLRLWYAKRITERRHVELAS